MLDPIFFLNHAAHAGGGGGAGAATLSSPTAVAATSTTATLHVTTDTGSGTLYWVASTSATPPSAAQIQAGNDSTGSAATTSGNQAVSGTGVQNATATGLTAFTTYYVYYAQHTAADSNVAATAAFDAGLGPEIVNDGTFSSGANWTQGSGWTISGNKGVAASATGFLWQSNAGIVAGHTYRTRYTISSYTSGFMFVYLGSSVTIGTQRSANGTYTENITPAGGGELGFSPSSTPILSVSADSCREVL